MAKRLTDLEITARVVPLRLRWPASGTNLAWTELHNAVDALQNLASMVNEKCAEAEQDTDLSEDGIMRRREQVGRQALGELREFKPAQKAENWVRTTVVSLEERMVDLPKQPDNLFDVMLAQEVRAHVARQKSPIDFVRKQMADPRVLGAVLNAPAFLSGLGDAEFNHVREQARRALHPEQDEQQTKLRKAIEELRAGVEACRRLVLQRCELREDGDGQYRPIRSPLPGGALAAAG
jgi:hypothetical protein